VLDPRLLAIAQQPLRITCELARLQQNILGRWSSQRVNNALFASSFGVQLLWDWHPKSMEHDVRPATLGELNLTPTSTWRRRASETASEFRDAYMHAM